jgi:ubiquinone/menaquinone biosynthesis C-methylase UbiE
VGKSLESLTTTEWHLRFLQQARWTQDLRQYLFGRLGLLPNWKVLEVGCGSGAILSELADQAQAWGLDYNADWLPVARQSAPRSRLTVGDAHALPYATAGFDLTVCHYLLLWVADPAQTLAEMRRVTRLGGAVLAMAEPDYGGRIDFPAELAVLGERQRQALRRQGAEPQAGRHLAGWLEQAGLQKVEVGVLGGQWRNVPTTQDWENEWKILQADLAGEIGLQELLRLRRLDWEAWQKGVRILYVPTFYAWGRVPEISS